MEAVPRLPMLSFSLKKSPEVTSFTNLKKFIAECYQDNPDTFAKEGNALEILRKEAVHPDFNSDGCAKLKRYYCQLHSLVNRFGNVNSRGLFTFVWKDLYGNNVIETNDLRFEMAAILYNIAALHTGVGAAVNRGDVDGMKLACTHFQCAAWAFGELKEKFHGVNNSNDFMISEMLVFMQQVCFAQAQECILEKSLIDNRKPAIVAKITAQIINYYNAALAALLTEGSDGPIAQAVDSNVYNKIWKKYVKFKVTYLTCILYLYQGMQSEEQQKMGERVVLYQAASNKLEEAKKCSKGMKDETEITEALTFTTDVVEGKRKAATSENEFIYHEAVPELTDIPAVQGANLVNGIGFSVTDPEASGEDIFERLIPMNAHEANSVYSEEKAKVLRKYGDKIEEKDTELETFLSSLNIEHINVSEERANKIPQGIVDRCASLNAKPNAIPDLITSMSNLAEICADVETNLKDIKELLNEEDLNEKQYQQKSGVHRSNAHVTELSREFQKYLEAHQKAGESNDTLRRAMELHVNNLRILSRPLQEIKSSMPKLSGEVNDEIFRDLKLILNKTNEMKAQRAKFHADLRISVNEDDITAKVIAYGNKDPAPLFAKELEKHNKICALLDQNLTAQGNILSALTEAYAKCAPILKTMADVKHKKETFFASLAASYDVYEDLLAKCAKGLEFYKKLQGNVQKLLARVKAARDVQDEERQQRLKSTKPSKVIDSNYGIVPTTKSSTPKLRDYLKSGKSVVGGDTTYIPPVRPNPLGSEAPSTSNCVTSTYYTPQSLPSAVDLPPAYNSGMQQYDANGYANAMYQQNQQQVGGGSGSFYQSQNPSYPQPGTNPSVSDYSQSQVQQTNPYQYPVQNVAQSNQGEFAGMTGYQLSSGVQPYTQQYPSQQQYDLQSMNSSQTMYSQPSAQPPTPSSSVVPQQQQQFPEGYNQNSNIPNSMYSKPSPQQPVGTASNPVIPPNTQINYNQPIQSMGSTMNQNPSYSQQNSATPASYYQQANTLNAAAIPATSQAYNYQMPSTGSYASVGYNQQLATSGTATNPTPSTIQSQSLQPTGSAWVATGNANQMENVNPQNPGQSSASYYPYQQQVYGVQQNPQVTPTDPQYSFQQITSHANLSGAATSTAGQQQSGNYCVHPGYSFNNQTGDYQYASGYLNNAPGCSQYTNAAPEQHSNTTNMLNSTNVGQPSANIGTQSNAMDQQENSNQQVTANSSQAITNQSYYTLPYGYLSTNVVPQHGPVGATIPQQPNPNEDTNPRAATYMQSNNNNSTYTTISGTYADTPPQNVTSSNQQQSSPFIKKSKKQDKPKKSSNIDLLSDIDFSISATAISAPPLQPQIAASTTAATATTTTVSSFSESRRSSQIVVQSDIKSLIDSPQIDVAMETIKGLEGAATMIPENSILSDRKSSCDNLSICSDLSSLDHSFDWDSASMRNEKMSQIAEKSAKFVDPFDDPKTLKYFHKEVERYEKMMESLNIKMLNGNTPLVNKWKELQDLLVKDESKRTTAIAKLFPEKNRSSDCIPYDHARVVLEKNTDDYINAAYVKDLGPECPTFILTQTPLQNTLNDFWSMIWGQKARTVVCLHTPNEILDTFWPQEGSKEMHFDDFTVTLVKQFDLSHCIELNLKVSMQGADAILDLSLLQIKAWTKSSPSQILGIAQNVLVAYKQKSQEFKSKSPLVMNCLTGSERSGIIALAICAILATKSKRPILINVVDVWYRICSQRKGALRDTNNLELSIQIVLSHAHDVLNKRGIMTSYQMKTAQTVAAIEKEEVKDPLNDLDPLWKLKQN